MGLEETYNVVREGIVVLLKEWQLQLVAALAAGSQYSEKFDSVCNLWRGYCLHNVVIATSWRGICLIVVVGT